MRNPAFRIQGSEPKGGAMSDRLENVYPPGVAISGCAAALIAAAAYLTLAELWTDPRRWVHALAAMAALAVYALPG
jgi:hypothetical protein